MSSLKIGVIGCGKQGGKHLRALKAIGGIDIAVTDRNDALAASLAAGEGVEHVEAAESFFADPTIAAVVICTPTLSHVELIEAALASDKHVFCEKPLCEATGAVEHLIEVEKSTGRNVMVGFIYRFAPAFERAHALLHARGEDESPILGRPVHALLRAGARGDSRAWKHRKAEGGGAVNEMLVHMLDLALWLFGPIPSVEILAEEVLLPSRRIDGARVTADAEDYVLARCTTARGAPVMILADLVTPGFIQFLDAHFTNGSFFGSIQPELPTRIFLKEARGEHEAGVTQPASAPTDLYRKQMRAFLDCVANDRPPDRNRLVDSLEVVKLTRTVHDRLSGR